MSTDLPLTVIPSLPAHSFAELETLTTALSGVAPGFQIDLVDGVFAEARSWPFTEADPLTELHRITTLPDSFAYELDCMVDQPERFLDVFRSLPITTVIIHVGSTDAYRALFSTLRAAHKQVGLAFTNDVPLEMVEQYIPEIDLVQVMGIAVVGKQGQSFDERTLETVRQLRARHPELSIAVDGSVNADTIASLKAVGADRFAPGSAISQSSDPASAYKQLVSLIA